MPRVRVRPYAGLRLWPGRPTPYLGLRLSLGRGRRRASKLLNDDGAGLRPRKRPPSLSNDA